MSDNRAWFIETILKATADGTLVHVEPRRNSEPSRTPVRVEIDRYGGARMDRISDRNKITTAFGFEPVSGSRFWSVNDVDNSGGTFLANVLNDYGTEHGGWFEINGESVPLHSDLTVRGRGYMDLTPSHWPTGEQTDKEATDE